MSNFVDIHFDDFFSLFFRLTNGSGGNDNTAMMWMMGTSLNSSSSAAREMDMVLKSEIAAHAAYDPNSRSNSLHGVSVPGKKKV